MSKYPEYRMNRSSFGLNALGTFVIEVESTSGEVGVGVSTGGVPACWIAENHLARFVEGQRADALELIWDQMWRATQFYGRKGLAMNVISAIDLALWDLLGKLRSEPVHSLIGGAVRNELEFYATGPRPDLAKELGFIGGKLPLVHGPAEGDEGLRKNLELAAEARSAVGSDFFLAFDAYMALDIPYALRLIDGLNELSYKWLEDFLLPDDYWGYQQVRQRAPRSFLLTGGEHEATRYGFRMLLEMGCFDILQPDVAWCGGLTELLKISALADAHGVPIVPHGSSVYSYHFVATRANLPFVEFVMLAPDAASIVPMFTPLFLNEPVPENGRLRVPDGPGFGVELNRELEYSRPFARSVSANPPLAAA
jgi:L-rhamnonate dehydratase